MTLNRNIRQLENKTPLQSQYIIDIPFWILVEQRTGRMNIYRGSLEKCLVSFLGILLGSIAEISTYQSTTGFLIIATARHNIMLITVNRY
jgi:hypothetical protein